MIDIRDANELTADDEALLDMAAALIDQLDAAAGDCDYEADCDEPAAPQWRIGALMRQRMARS